MRNSSPSAAAANPADTITSAIIERLEAGVRPWRQPWTGGPVSRPLRVCGTPYRGANVIWLWMAAQSAGYASPTWMTYHQARLLGGQVRKGARGTMAIFYKSYTKRADDAAPDGREEKTRRVLRSFTVFNVDQIDGLPDRFRPAGPPLADPTERDRDLDAFFATIPADVRHDGGDAYYEPRIDRITMPDVALFRSRDLYRATLAHELAHWTGHESRLARSLAHRFGSDAYAMEELIAELASAMIGAELGLPVDHLDDHAAYLASWLKVLKADNRAILTAAARAEDASALLLRLGRAEPASTPALLAA